MACRPGGRFSSFQVLFFNKESNSSWAALSHISFSGLSMASLKVVGSVIEDAAVRICAKATELELALFVASETVDRAALIRKSRRL